jgi:glycosyltransferase involved in cell wall biosynthesis
VTNPLISIITPSYNQAGTLRATIESVLTQDYSPIEYQVIDGGSTDGTLDILRSYGDRLRWVSEKDQGQADAINKGLRQTSGAIMGWVNSDDLYVPGALRQVAAYFQAHPEAMFIYGDAEALDETGNNFGIRTHVKAGGWHELVHELDFLVQPACFWRREVWDTLGELDASLHYTLDYEYWMRVARRYPIQYLPVLLAQERLYAGAKTGRGAVERIEEIAQVAIRHGGTGLPYNYRAEGAAQYSLRALASLRRREWSAVRADFRRALDLRPPWGKYARFMGVMLLLGPSALSGVWLRLNRWRQRRKQSVLRP